MTEELKKALIKYDFKYYLQRNYYDVQQTYYDMRDLIWRNENKTLSKEMEDISFKDFGECLAKMYSENNSVYWECVEYIETKWKLCMDLHTEYKRIDELCKKFEKSNTK